MVLATRGGYMFLCDSKYHEYQEYVYTTGSMHCGYKIKTHDVLNTSLFIKNLITRHKQNIQLIIYNYYGLSHVH